MAFDSLGRYTPNHKTWDHVGNVIPVVEHSEGIRPHGEFKPAPWLPVQFYDKFYEVWYVAMPGKLLAFDNDGWVVPAQYGLSGAAIVYTADDVTAGVIDVRTGVTLLSGATGSVNVGAVSDYMGQGNSEALAISMPVGVAPYGMFQWGGDASTYDDGFNPAGLREHNHNLQHQVAILCDYVLELPLVPMTLAAAENMARDTFTAATNRQTFTAVASLPVATNTVRSPITFANGTLGDSSTRFVVQKDAATDVLAMGDWHINYTTGVVTCYATTVIQAGAVYTITYSHYATVPTTVSKFACAVGDLSPGDFVKCDTNSNFTVATPKVNGDGESDAFDTFSAIMGQVLEVESVLGKDYLDRVRTAYSPAIGTSAAGAMYAGAAGYSGQLDQMPGSANGGVTDKVHYAGAANLVVRINLISR